VVEATLWCGPLARVARRATLLPEGLMLAGSGDRRAAQGPVRRFLFDPDGAVVRAHLVAEFADTVGGTLADPTIAYVYADAPAATGFARCYEVIEALPFSLKRLRAVLRQRGVGRLTIKKRGSPIDPDRLRRELHPTGTAEATLVLTRVAGAPTALLCEPVPSARIPRQPAGTHREASDVRRQSAVIPRQPAAPEQVSRPDPAG
jgi:hypothetical protein